MNKTEKTKSRLKTGVVLAIVIMMVTATSYTTVKAVQHLLSTLTDSIIATRPMAQNVDFPPTLPDPIPSEESVKDPSKPRTIDLTQLGHDPFILLYGPIMQNGNEIARLITDTAKKGHPIYLLIDSPGGSVLSGGAVVSAIEAAQVPVNTVCLQLCASMAAIIHQYGSQRLMVDRSFLMFHNASGGFQGSFPQVQSQFNTINRFVSKMLVHIAKRSEQSPKAFLDKLGAEVWIDAEDSLAEHYSDETVEILYDEMAAVNPPSFLDLQTKNNFKEKFNILNVQ